MVSKKGFSKLVFTSMGWALLNSFSIRASDAKIWLTWNISIPRATQCLQEYKSSCGLCSWKSCLLLSSSQGWLLPVSQKAEMQAAPPRSKSRGCLEKFPSLAQGGGLVQPRRFGCWYLVEMPIDKSVSSRQVFASFPGSVSQSMQTCIE